MVEVQTWVIIGLVALSWFQFTSPDKADKLVSPVWDTVNGFFQDKGFFDKKPDAGSDICPDTIELVCGSNGITYDNICKAAMADILEVTPGSC